MPRVAVVCSDYVTLIHLVVLEEEGVIPLVEVYLPSHLLYHSGSQQLQVTEEAAVTSNWEM